MSGLEGGFTFDKRFLLGLRLEGSAHDVDIKGRDDVIYRAKFNTAGVKFGYNFFSTQALHIQTNVLLGAGVLSLADRKAPVDDAAGSEWEKPDSSYDHYYFSLIEPSIGVEANITTWFQMGLNASYRHVANNTKLYSANDMRRVGGELVFKFGKF